MYKHCYGAGFVGFSHLLRPHGAEPLIVCQGKLGGSGDVGARCY